MSGAIAGAPSCQTHVVEALGVGVRIDADACTPRQFAVIRAAWESADPGVVPRVVVECAGGLDDDVLLARLSAEVTQEAMRAQRGRLWMLHASAVALPSGRVVAFVGPSGMGKTTAAREIGRHHGYVTDETVGIDRNGVVHPLRKPLSVVSAGTPTKSQCAPSELGLRPLPEGPLTIAALIVLRREGEVGAQGSRLDPLPAGEALADLALHSSFLSELPRALRMMLRLMSDVGGVHRATYDTAHQLLDLASQAVRPSARTRGIPPRRAVDGVAEAVADADADGHPATPDRRRITRTRHLDSAALGDGTTVVLHPSASGGVALSRLPPPLSTIWNAALEASPLEIEGAITGEPALGSDHVDVADIVETHVGHLVRVGLVAETEGRWHLANGVAWSIEGEDASVTTLEPPGSGPRTLVGQEAHLWSILAERGPLTTTELLGLSDEPTSGEPGVRLRRLLRAWETAGLVEVSALVDPV